MATSVMAIPASEKQHRRLEHGPEPACQLLEREQAEVGVLHQPVDQPTQPVGHGYHPTARVGTDPRNQGVEERKQDGRRDRAQNQDSALTKSPQGKRQACADSRHRPLSLPGGTLPCTTLMICHGTASSDQMPSHATPGRHGTGRSAGVFAAGPACKWRGDGQGARVKSWRRGTTGDFTANRWCGPARDGRRATPPATGRPGQNVLSCSRAGLIRARASRLLR